MKKRRNRFLAVLMAFVMVLSVMPLSVLAGTTPLPNNDMSAENQKLAKELEAECVVLLENDGILPLDVKNDKIAVFGEGQVAPPGGGGSGGASGAFTVNLRDGLDSINAQYYTELTNYIAARTGGNSHGWNTSTEYPDEWGKNASSNTGWNRTSAVQNPEVKLDDGLIKDDGIVAAAREYADTAVVYISRNTGVEEMDRNPDPQPGDWYLNASERIMLEQVSDKFDNIVLIFTGTAPINLSQFDKYPIRAFLLEYGAGQFHGYALANILFGLTNPSGKLNDSLTYEYTDHPTSENFGYTSYADKGYDWEGNVSKYGSRKFSENDPILAYEEYIYMGYKYFDTFDGSVKYPFGHGLSYSNFTFTDMSVSADAVTNNLTVKATVNNTSAEGTVAGKEVMQVYVSKPQGKLEQAYQNLVSFDKTSELASGESEKMEITIPVADLASYDEDLAAYVLEAGEYIIRVGNSSRNTHVAGKLKVEKTFIVEQLSNQLEMQEVNEEVYNANRLKYADATPISYEGETEEIQSAECITIDESFVEQSLIAPEVPKYDFTPLPDTAPTYKFEAVKKGIITPEQFVAQFSDEELVNLLSGGRGAGGTILASDDASIQLNEQDSKIVVTGGAGRSRAIHRLGFPSLSYADGGSGISFSLNGQQANTGWPRPAGFACSWNPEGYYLMGVAMGHEMVAANIDNWLAPSINMHRYPFGGRNLEYWSEDPILAGTAAANVAKGVSESGVTVCLKHFAANDQEWYRRGLYTSASISQGTSKAAVNVIAPERVIREIYLKPFQIAVETGAVYNIMSAFNSINSQACASSPELLTNILRGEWGFKGYVVTDWGDYDDIAEAAREMAAGNDMIMSGNHTRYNIHNELWEGYRNGLCTREDLQRNAYNVVVSALHSSLANDKSKHNDPGQLKIATSSLVNARIGVDYTETKANPIWANGSVDAVSYTFSLSEKSAALPEGMELLPNGRIIGAPASGTAGKYNLIIKVEDDLGNTATKSLPLTVDPNYVFITSELSDAKAGTEYNQAVVVQNYIGTEINFSLSDGKLPNGLTFSNDGVISGTPENGTSGFYDITVHVGDSQNSAEHNYKLFVEGSIDISPESGSILKAAEGELFKHELAADGYEFKLDSENGAGLPDGISITETDGTYYISGVPSFGTSGTYEAYIIASKDGIDEYIKYVIEVEESETVTTSIPNPKAGSTYEPFQIVTGITGDLTYSVTNGELPNGMFISNDGILSGFPAATSSGLYPVTIQVTNGTDTYSYDYTIYVEGVLNFTPSADSVLKAMENQPFNQNISATGGFSEEYSYVVSDFGDALPAGLTLTVNDDHTATISGTPESGTEGTYNVYILVDETFAGSPVTSYLHYVIEVSSAIIISKDSITDIKAADYISASEGITLEPCSDGGGGMIPVGTTAGKWLKYDVSVEETKAYTFDARIATAVNSSFSVMIDGKTIGTSNTIGSTGSIDTWSTVNGIFTAILEKGQHEMTISVTNGEINFNYLTITPVNDTEANIHVLAGNDLIKVNATEFMSSGGGVRAETQNDGGNTDGGKNMGYLEAGGYMTYYIDAEKAGTYDFFARIASSAGKGNFDVYVDNQKVLSVSNTQATGSWTSWISMVPAEIELTEGKHIVKIAITAGGMNINYFGFQYLGDIEKVVYNLDKFEMTKIKAVDYTHASSGIGSQPCQDEDGGRNTTYTKKGAWLVYHVDAKNGGTYNFNARYAGPDDGIGFDIYVDGVRIGGYSGLNNTGGWQTWKTSDDFTMRLSSGVHEIRIYFTGNEQNVNYFTLTPQIITFEESGATKIKAINYSIGSSNIGSEPCQDEDGGMIPTYTVGGNWMAFDTTVPTSGTYDFYARYAGPYDGIGFDVYVDGELACSYSGIEKTGGWQIWKTSEVSQIRLEAGYHRIMMRFTGEEQNFNYFNFTLRDEPQISVEAPESVIKNQKFEAVLTIPYEIENVKFINEIGRKVTHKIVSRTVNDDGSVVLTVSMSVGTAGNGRELSIYDGDILLGSMVFNVETVPTGIISVDAPSEAFAGQPFRVTAVTTKDLYKAKFFNESGMVIGSTCVSKVVDGDYRTCIYELSIGTKGENRTITMKADFDKMNNFDTYMEDFTITIK